MRHQPMLMRTEGDPSRYLFSIYEKLRKAGKAAKMLSFQFFSNKSDDHLHFWNVNGLKNHTNQITVSVRLNLFVVKVKMNQCEKLICVISKALVCQDSWCRHQSERYGQDRRHMDDKDIHQQRSMRGRPQIRPRV